MNQSIHECFSNSFVNDSVVIPLEQTDFLLGSQLKRNPPVADHTRVCTLKKLKQICGPGTIRPHPVGPADEGIRRKSFSVVYMVLRYSRRITDCLVLPEHQQPGDSQPFVARCPICSPATELFKQSPVVNL